MFKRIIPVCQRHVGITWFDNPASPVLLT